MGKKRVIKQSNEEAIKEVEVLESAMKKAESSEQTRRPMQAGRVYIATSYNNIIMTATDFSGNVIGWTSGGHLQFKGPKKATPFAAARVAEALVQKIRKAGINEFQVFIRGVGGGRESALRTLISQGLNIISIKDITPVAHGGVRPPKVRRV
jgi:small subunit ribosomal protein S11